MIRAACASALAIAMPFAAAAASDFNWLLAAAPNGAYSVETPCTAAEIAALADTPNSLPNVELTPESRVMCAKDAMIFMAGVVEVKDMPAGVTVMDSLLERSENDPSADGKPTATTIGGRRAMINREVDGKGVAQTGFIEISANKIVVLVAGGNDGDLSVAEQGQAIDRFFASAKVTSK